MNPEAPGPAPAASAAAPTETILGIRFHSGTVDEALALARAGGLVLAPSGPGLAELDRDPDYRAALAAASLNLLDSGLLVLLWRLRTGRRLAKVSGYLFLVRLLETPDLRVPGASFWVHPTPAAEARNLAWLRARGLPLDESDSAVAPRYPANGPLDDPDLRRRLEERRPRWVILNIGGGVQERLGHGLLARLSYRPTIVCTGAAIAFLTGEQANIPAWADRWTLGWLARCLQAPRTFVPRYVRAARLACLVFRC